MNSVHIFSYIIALVFIMNPAATSVVQADAYAAIFESTNGMDLADALGTYFEDYLSGVTMKDKTLLDVPADAAVLTTRTVENGYYIRHTVTNVERADSLKVHFQLGTTQPSTYRITVKNAGVVVVDRNEVVSSGWHQVDFPTTQSGSLEVTVKGVATHSGDKVVMYNPTSFTDTEGTGVGPSTTSTYYYYHSYTYYKKVYYYVTICDPVNDGPGDPGDPGDPRLLAKPGLVDPSESSCQSPEGPTTDGGRAGASGTNCRTVRKYTYVLTTGYKWDATTVSEVPGLELYRSVKDGREFRVGPVDNGLVPIYDTNWNLGDKDGDMTVGYASYNYPVTGHPEVLKGHWTDLSGNPLTTYENTVPLADLIMHLHRNMDGSSLTVDPEEFFEKVYTVLKDPLGASYATWQEVQSDATTLLKKYRSGSVTSFTYYTLHKHLPDTGTGIPELWLVKKNAQAIVEEVYGKLGLSSHYGSALGTEDILLLRTHAGTAHPTTPYFLDWLVELAKDQKGVTATASFEESMQTSHDLVPTLTTKAQLVLNPEAEEGEAPYAVSLELKSNGHSVQGPFTVSVRDEETNELANTTTINSGSETINLPDYIPSVVVETTGHLFFHDTTTTVTWEAEVDELFKNQTKNPWTYYKAYIQNPEVFSYDPATGTYTMVDDLAHIWKDDIFLYGKKVRGYSVDPTYPAVTFTSEELSRFEFNGEEVHVLRHYTEGVELTERSQSETLGKEAFLKSWLSLKLDPLVKQYNPPNVGELDAFDELLSLVEGVTSKDQSTTTNDVTRAVEEGAALQAALDRVNKKGFMNVINQEEQWFSDLVVLWESLVPENIREMIEGALVAILAVSCPAAFLFMYWDEITSFVEDFSLEKVIAAGLEQIKQLFTSTVEELFPSEPNSEGNGDLFNLTDISKTQIEDLIKSSLDIIDMSVISELTKDLPDVCTSSLPFIPGISLKGLAATLLNYVGPGVYTIIWEILLEVVMEIISNNLLSVLPTDDAILTSLNGALPTGYSLSSFGLTQDEVENMDLLTVLPSLITEAEFSSGIASSFITIVTLIGGPVFLTLLMIIEGIECFLNAFLTLPEDETSSVRARIRKAFHALFVLEITENVLNLCIAKGNWVQEAYSYGVLGLHVLFPLLKGSICFYQDTLSGGFPEFLQIYLYGINGLEAVAAFVFFFLGFKVNPNIGAVQNLSNLQVWERRFNMVKFCITLLGVASSGGVAVKDGANFGGILVFVKLIKGVFEMFATDLDISTTKLILGKTALDFTEWLVGVFSATFDPL